MIHEQTGNLFDNLTEQSVILHQCNVNGWMGSGFAARVRIKYPQAFKDYHEYCGWFKDGHEKELLGTWARTQINENLIICNAITQLTYAKSKHVIDYSSWHKILKKLEHQTRYVNEHYGKNWTIHVPDKINGNSNVEEYETLHELFHEYFDESPVNVVFHRY